MIEETCQIVPSNTQIINKSTGWQKIMIITALVLLFIILLYFLFKFISHTNKRFKMVEQAINQMNERIRTQPPVETKPSPSFPPHMFMMRQAPSPQQPVQQQQPPVVVAQQQSTPIVDTKVLDKELSEELSELDASVVKNDEPEGRVDNLTENKEEDTTT